MTLCNPLWPATPLWEAAAARDAYAHQVRWPEAEVVRQRVLDTLREQGGDAHMACALDARRLVSHLTTLPLSLDDDVRAEIDALVARCRSSSSSPGSAISLLGNALSVLRVSDNPVLQTALRLAQEITNGRRSVQILLPPATPRRWIPLIESSMPSIKVVPFTARLNAPVTAAAIMTGAPNRYGGSVDRYDPNANLRGAWILHAAPAHEVHIVSVLESLEDEPKGIIVYGPGVPVRLHSGCRASGGSASRHLDHDIGRLLASYPLPPPHPPDARTPTADARRILLSDGDHIYLDANDSKSVLTITAGRLRQVGLTTRESDTWTLDAGARVVLRSSTSEREAVNERAYELLGRDAPTARALLEHLRDGSAARLRGMLDDSEDDLQTYLRGWAAMTLCFPTKHVSLGHRAAIAAGRPLDEVEVSLLARVRVCRQRAGALLVDDVTSTLEGLLDAWDIEGHDDLETEAGVLHLRTISAVDRTTVFQVAHTDLGRLHRARTT